LSELITEHIHSPNLGLFAFSRHLLPHIHENCPHWRWHAKLTFCYPTIITVHRSLAVSFYLAPSD